MTEATTRDTIPALDTAIAVESLLQGMMLALNSAELTEEEKNETGLAWVALGVQVEGLLKTATLLRLHLDGANASRVPITGLMLNFADDTAVELEVREVRQGSDAEAMDRG